MGHLRASMIRSADAEEKALNLEFSIGVRLAAEARRRQLVAHAIDEKWEHQDHGRYYEVIDLETAREPQVILSRTI